MGIRAKFAHLWPLSRPNINIFQWEQLYLINSVQFYIHCNFKLGISKNVDFIAENPYFLQFFAFFSIYNSRKIFLKSTPPSLLNIISWKLQDMLEIPFWSYFTYLFFEIYFLDLATPIFWHLGFPQNVVLFVSTWFIPGSLIQKPDLIAVIQLMIYVGYGIEIQKIYSLPMSRSHLLGAN